MQKKYWNDFWELFRESLIASKEKMSKSNQKIVLFIEPAVRAYQKPSKIGNLFMNRFAIDEDANHEILKIYHLENNFFDVSEGWLSSEEGLDLTNYMIITYDS